MSKKILMVRPAPWDSDFKAYNIQEVGLGKAFCRLGYDYDYICMSTNPKPMWTFYEYEGCCGRYIEKPRRRVLRWAFNREVVSRDFLKDYDIVISREYYLPMTSQIAKHHDNVSMYNGPYWNMLMPKFIAPLYDLFVTRKMVKNLKHVFVKSELSKVFLEKKGYHDIVNVGVGLDMERFDADIPIAPDTQVLIDYMTHNRCLLYVGHLDANKNLPFMLKLFQRLLDKEPDLKFVMIGKSCISAIKKVMGKKDEDYAREEFAKLPQDVRDGIKHIKRVENTQLKYIYPLAKAFILPSKLEIFGMVMAEAMYLGAPVITTRNGGSTSLIEGRETGIMIDGFDVEQWENAVLKLLHDPNYKEKMTINARNVIVNEYNWDNIAKRMLEEIEIIK